MHFCGIDEAALGPSLGPFCVCLTSFSLPFETSQLNTLELYNLLSSFISHGKNTPGYIPVADSKVLYTPCRGIDALEQGVTAFIDAAGISLPCSLTNLLSVLAPPSDLQALEGVPWYEQARNFTIPWGNGIPASTHTRAHDQTGKKLFSPLSSKPPGLKMALKNLGVNFKLPSVRFIPAVAFNREIGAMGGKGGATRHIIAPLIKEACTGDSGSHAGRRITIDRQGGRRYYGAWLKELMPGITLHTLEEGRKRSAYSSGSWQIEFLVRADGIRLETALASMFAKYIRESAMQLFNRWWADRIPGIVATAGYPQDAKRFISAIKVAGAMPDNQDMLIRRL